MDDRFVVVGLTNGSVSCIYVRNNVIKWVISISNHPITAVLADLYDQANDQLFYAGDAAGKIFVINEKGKIMLNIDTKGPKIFSILASYSRKIVAYYDGGAYEYEVKFPNASLTKVYRSTGNYSIDADGTFHETRKKVNSELNKLLHIPHS